MGIGSVVEAGQMFQTPLISNAAQHQTMDRLSTDELCTDQVDYLEALIKKYCPRDCCCVNGLVQNARAITTNYHIPMNIERNFDGSWLMVEAG